MTKRERLRRVMLREMEGPVPLDLGSSPNTAITRIAYENLAEHLGIFRNRPSEIFHVPFQLVEMDDEVLDALHIDTRHVGGADPKDAFEPVPPEGRLKDKWGIVWRPAIANGQLTYYEVERSPLVDGTGLELEAHAWPDPQDLKWTRDLRRRAMLLDERGDVLVVGHHGDTSIFENARDVRGMVPFMMDLVRNKDYAHALLDRMTEIQCATMEAYLKQVGSYLDVVCIGDDLAGQDRPLISLALYREMVKPYHRRYFETIKKNTDALLHMHSCGAVENFLDDLIELGVDIINPVQVTAKGMDPIELRKRYGDRITFWGAIDSQRVLPLGCPDDVRQAVRDAIAILGSGGGYVLSAVHNIQSDVPAENVVAMFDEAHRVNGRWQ